MKDKYLRSVAALLGCPRAERARLLARLERAVDAYLEDQPEAGEADLAAVFGAPEDRAVQLLAECAPAALASDRQRKRRRGQLMAALLASLLVLTLALTAYLWSAVGPPDREIEPGPPQSEVPRERDLTARSDLSAELCEAF